MAPQPNYLGSYTFWVSKQLLTEVAYYKGDSTDIDDLKRKATEQSKILNQDILPYIRIATIKHHPANT